jgi:hypothetical protein
VGGLFEVAEELAAVTLRQASLSHLGFYFNEDVGEEHHTEDGPSLPATHQGHKEEEQARKLNLLDPLAGGILLSFSYAYDITANLLKDESDVFRRNVLRKMTDNCLYGFIRLRMKSEMV